MVFKVRKACQRLQKMKLSGNEIKFQVNKEASFSMSTRKNES